MTDEVAELQGEDLPEITADGELEESLASEAEEANQDETPAEPPKARGVQKRLDELTSLRRDAERDRDYWRELAIKQSAQKEPEPRAEAPQGKPVLDAYPSYEEYIEAVADWKVEQRLSAEREQQTRVQQETAQQQTIREFQSRADRVRESHPDFDDVVGNRSLAISEAMVEAAYGSEKGPELLYHLGQNPKEAERIYNLPPYQAAMEMGRLEAALSRPSRKNPSAPDPIRPIAGGGGSQTVDPDSMTAEQWAIWRNKQLSR